MGGQVAGLCTACHGGGLVSAGMAPDLRASAVPFSLEALTAVVRDGQRVSMGMPQYPDISEGELVALQHYIRMVARENSASTELTTE